MRFDDDGVDVSRVSDRRGRRGAAVAAGGGGIGLVGLLIVVLLQVLGGGSGVAVDPSLLGPAVDGAAGQQPGEDTDALAERCNTDGALERYTDCRLIKVVNVADDVWSAEFAERGLDYRPPTLAFFSGIAATGGCGRASAEVGPFYCPADETIYFELDFLEVLQDRFGAEGQFAQAYIAAHEFGHHLQAIDGTMDEVRRAQQADPGNANDYAVALELQADCYAGVWSALADAAEGEGIVLTREDVAQAIAAAEAVGDDRIQEATTGQVNPETWTHGSAEQRREWFERGLETGDLARCDTFA
ncbi:MAG: neutral zinc metallopeptidase [Kineosporiaceae bacterium]